jgi:iron complex outermembrane receptor protein
MKYVIHRARLVAAFSVLLPALVLCQKVVAAVDSNAPSAALDEVVVTARRVSESEQKTPVTVTSFDSKDLQRLAVRDSTDLNGLVPNMLISPVGSGTGAVQVFMRGIGQSALAFNLESPVGTYLDDVYLGRIQGALFSVLDIDRIEVLRGPQGTLYGRNSTVGAVKYVTVDPDLNTAHYGGTATFGSYDRKDFNVFASIPLIDDQLAVKVDIASLNSDGYIKLYNSVGGPQVAEGNGQRTKTGRMTFLWKPSSDWRIDLSVDATDNLSGSSQGTPLLCNAAGTSCPYALGSPYKAGDNGANAGYVKDSGISLKIEHMMDWASFKSISAFRNLHDFDSIDLTAEPGVAELLPDHKDQRQVSEELQLISAQDQRLTWVGGLFFYDEHIRHTDDFLGYYYNDDKQVAKSYAIYGDATYKITDKLSFDGGVRFSKDTKQIDRSIDSDPGVSIFDGYASFNTSAVTYKGGFDYAFLPDTLGYVTFSTGYRPGSFGETYPGQAQIATNSVLTHLSNETAKNYEIGLKNEFFDHRLRVNVDGFYTRYDNLQTESSTAPFPVLSNNVRLAGVELEGQAKPIPQLTLRGNASYLQGKIDAGEGTGSVPQYAPKFKFSLGGEYRQPFSDFVEGFVSVDDTYTTAFTEDAPPIPATLLYSVTQRAYNLLGAQFGADLDGGRYRAAVAGKNLTSATYFYGIVPGAEQFFGPPREVMLSLSVHY